MKHFYTFLVAILFTGFGFGQTLSQGDLAIIGVSVDNEEILVVALEDIPAGESVFFTDDEWSGNAFNTGEGFYEWLTPSITAGTVITITTTGTTAGGSVNLQAGSFALSNSGDGVFLYQTSTNTYNTGTYTLLGFAGEDGGDAGTLTGSGLTLGTTAIYYGGDNGIYTGTRTGQDKATYLSLIYDSGNWATSGSAQTFDTTAFTFSGGSPSTSVEFATASASVSEGVGTTDLIFSITNPDGTNATSFDVELIIGDNADINGYTTQTVTFPAGSSTDETVTITVTDDTVFEGDETLIFTITGVTGGNNATLGTQSTFELTIEENDPNPAVAFWHEPFNNNNLYTVTIGGEGNDGTADYFQITDGLNINQSYTNIDGTFHASQDIDDGGWTNSAAPSQLTWTGIDISEFTTLSFKGSFASNGGGIDESDFVLVEYQIDNGGWMNLLAFENTGGFNNNFFEDTDFDGTGDGLELSDTFQEFEKSIPIGSSLDLRITVSVDSGGEDLAFDNFKVEGIYNGYAYSNGSWYPTNPDNTTGASNAIVVDGVAIFTTDVNLNDVVVSPGAGLDVETGNTLTVNSLNLESTSTTFSSLISDGTITGTVTYNRYINTNNAVNGNDLISAPLSGQNFDVFIGNNTNILTNPSGPEVLFGGFDNDNASAPYELWNDTDTTPLTAGIGYRTGIEVGAPTNLVSFEGTVNTGLVEVAINQGSASILNLVGNPFPSYLDAQAFLTQNAAVLDPSAVVIYGYNDSTDGTSADDYTIISAIENNTLNIAPGQGFFVASNVVGGNLQFTTSTPDMRIISTDDDFIAGRSAISNVNINLSNATDNFITKVYFTASSGLGLDPGYDASLLGGVAPAFSLFSHLVEENMDVPFATQAIGKTDYNDTTIALGVNANMGEQLTFSIAENTMPASIEVYLDDTLTSTSTLLNAADYVLTPSEDLNGTGRFYLRFSNSALSTTDAIFDGISIYGNQTNRTISIAGQLTEGTSANVYDIQGRLVTARPLVSDSTLQTIDASNLHTGVYIVKLVNGNVVKAEKIILK
ncbi:hypothetical protein BWZ20_06370 [Winogradskyella sp. J14-2]|uniref:beta strand repeat-containing protein n=1 Tax=Winogradskyella sp. J14-2 TaxID=1936080 RepID=UPI0009728311|nr:T9SS type A sorting domain-containing protein [Winogradskyella sp. J14-2]APY07950.1 hypothetical protein BWZ20_06370 [Winogradskyella sp. J14-2]